MPSHPDRVRKNYDIGYDFAKKESTSRVAFTFKGISFHVCDKAPKYPPVSLITPNMSNCPYCGENVKCPNT